MNVGKIGQAVVEFIKPIVKTFGPSAVEGAKFGVAATAGVGVIVGLSKAGNAIKDWITSKF